MNKLERADLVHVIKALNQGLQLKPAIKTKVGDTFVADDELKKIIIKIAKGYDEKTGKYVEADAVTRTNVELDVKTWAVLDCLLATKADKKADKKTDKASADKGKTALKSPETKEIRKPREVRSAGRFPTEFKALKKHLEAMTGEVSLAREYDRQLLTKATLAEHLAMAEKIQKKHGVTRSIIPHIKWRVENDGWLFKDTRKFQHDENGIVQLIGSDPAQAKKVKFDMPLKGSSPKKAEKSPTATKVAPKAEKSEKVAPKAEKKAIKAKKSK